MIACFLSALLFFHFALADNYTANVNTMQPYFQRDPGHWLSMEIDVKVMTTSTNWSGTLAGLATLVPLARAFQPSRLRWGGFEQDFVKYNFFGNSTDTGYHQGQFLYTMTADQLDQLYSFATNAGWELAYGLTLWQDFDGTAWNSSNAKVFLDYANSKGYKLNFELGQEPDLFPSPGITGDKIAQAYGTFRQLLSNYDLYKDNSIVQGPSIAQPLTFPQLLNDFLDNGGGNYIDALSFHHYYNNGAGCDNLTSFVDPATLDSLIPVLEVMTNYSFRPLWFSETGTKFYCWNALTYASGFMWMDKLGLSAKYQIEQINRDSFYGIELGVVGPALNTLPDYWLFLLYKKLVGGAVYNVTITPDDRKARLYAGSSTSDSTTIVIYGINVNNVSATVDLPQFPSRQATLYLLKESDAGDLASNLSLINGDLITWNSHQPGPRLRKSFVTLPLVLPAYSQFYLVVNQTKYSACPIDWYNEKTTANKCVIFKTAYTFPFFAAQLECDVFGTNSSTLTIGSAFENNELLTQAKAKGSGQLYIGLIRNGTTWVWSNGDTSSYRNWAQGFPVNDSTKNCVTFSSTDGTWTNSDCDNSQSSICQLYF